MIYSFDDPIRESIMRAQTAGLVMLVLGVLVTACSGMAVYPPDKVAKVNGTELAYTDAGQGVPVVFVHGALGDTRDWATQRGAIAGNYRFIAYSLRYHEPNKWRDDGKQYSVQTHVEDLAAFIKALNAGPVHLVGHSYGGHIAARVALVHPELVKTLILDEAAIPSLVNSPEGKAAVADFYKVVPSVKSAVKDGNSVEATRLYVDAVLGEQGGFDMLPPTVIDMLKANAKTVGPLLAGPPPAPPIDCARAGTISPPTLVLGGERSIAFFRYINEELARCIPGSERVTIPGADHMMQLRNPKGFNDALLAFVAKHP